MFLPRLHPEDEDDSAEELSADEGENSDTNNPTLNFFGKLNIQLNIQRICAAIAIFYVT